jgi:hypothetical protein
MTPVISFPTSQKFPASFLVAVPNNRQPVSNHGSGHPRWAEGNFQEYMTTFVADMFTDAALEVALSETDHLMAALGLPEESGVVEVSGQAVVIARGNP